MVVEMISNQSGCRGDWVAHCKSFFFKYKYNGFLPERGQGGGGAINSAEGDAEGNFKTSSVNCLSREAQRCTHRTETVLQWVMAHHPKKKR